MDDGAGVVGVLGTPDPFREIRRRYVTRQTVQRVHQRRLREQVVAAYRRQCALCHLKRVELLDAAHILRDGHPRGLPVVSNGISFCTLHHRAFDRNVLGVRPDLVVEIRSDVLKEEDGPAMEHLLQGLHGTSIVVPRNAKQRPDREGLEERYEEFRRAM